MRHLKISNISTYRHNLVIFKARCFKLFILVIINNKLTWDENCAHIIKKVNNRMALIRNAKSFGATTKELVHLWIVFCRNFLEQVCILWHNSLTQENVDDLERTQRTFAKLVLGQNFKNYDDALIKLNLLPLNQRKENLCLKFAQSSLENGTMTDLITLNDKKHIMETRHFSTYQVDSSNTARYGKSSVPFMQNLLNRTN